MLMEAQVGIAGGRVRRPAATAERRGGGGGGGASGRGGGVWVGGGGGGEPLGGGGWVGRGGRGWASFGRVCFLVLFFSLSFIFEFCSFLMRIGNQPKKN